MRSMVVTLARSRRDSVPNFPPSVISDSTLSPTFC